MRHEPQQYLLVCDECLYRVSTPEQVAELGEVCPDCGSYIGLLGGTYGVTSEKERLRPGLKEELREDGYKHQEELSVEYDVAWEEGCYGEVYVVTDEALRALDETPDELLRSGLPGTPKSAAQKIDEIEDKLLELIQEVEIEPSRIREAYE